MASFGGFNKGAGSIFDADAKKKAEEELAKQKTSKVSIQLLKEFIPYRSTNYLKILEIWQVKTAFYSNSFVLPNLFLEQWDN